MAQRVHTALLAASLPRILFKKSQEKPLEFLTTQGPILSLDLTLSHHQPTMTQ